MGRLTINKDQTNFLLEGKPFFYLADTVWSAFTNTTEEDWNYYLRKRREQGFTALQINTLPQWDRCMADTGIYPFASDDGGITFDFTRWNQAYYDRARKMCRMAVEQGFQLALVVLWLNYVPGTWGSKAMDNNVMPKSFVREYAEKVVAEFDEFDPIYVISGDTDFSSPETEEYYQLVLDTVCEKSPDSLKSFHICRGSDVIPESFLNKIDFYMFQSGHNRDGQNMAYVLPENFRAKYPKKPMVNAEPCYEHMGYSRRLYGRFQREDVRRAAWQSLLSGACAGVTYGADGIYNWSVAGGSERKNPIMSGFFDDSRPWQDALQFPGAWDYGFIRTLLQSVHAYTLKPANELIENDVEEIRMARTEGGNYLLYLPRSTDVVLKKDLSGYTVRTVSLQTRDVAYQTIKVQDGRTTIPMHPFSNDALLIIEKSAS